MLDDTAWHGYRRLWQNLRTDLGWVHNKNSAYAGGWSTKIGSTQDAVYNRVKPYFIQAVIDGKTIVEVLTEDATGRAKDAINLRIPVSRTRAA